MSRATGRRIDPPVGQDLACTSCSYNLRGLSVSGKCPECGTPVKTSLYAQPDEALADAEPGHVRGLGRSALMMLCGLGVAGLTPAMYLIAQGFADRPRRPYDASTILFGGDLLARVLICYAVFLVTRREPDRPHNEHPGVAALVLRVACVGGLIAPLMIRWIGRVPEILLLPLGMTALLAVLATGTYFWFLGGIARRLPPERQIDREINLLVPIAPAMFLISACFREEPMYSAFPHLPFGYPAEDFAYLFRNPLRNGVPPISHLLPLVPILVHGWVASVLVRLWLALRDQARMHRETFIGRTR